MASYPADKASTSSIDQKVLPPPDDNAYTLDEKRRAALAEIDSAKFSYVSHLFSLFIFTHLLLPLDGFT